MGGVGAEVARVRGLLSCSFALLLGVLPVRAVLSMPRRCKRRRRRGVGDDEDGDDEGEGNAESQAWAWAWSLNEDAEGGGHVCIANKASIICRVVSRRPSAVQGLAGRRDEVFGAQ